MSNEVRHVDYGDTRMYYSVSGPADGAPVVVMHGWGCNSSTIVSVASIAARTHRVYNVDFPGFGMSPEPSDVWGVDDYTRLIEALVDAEDLKKPVLIGHSFGGRVGILYASRREVSKLVLVDAAGIKPRPKLKKVIKQTTYKTLRRTLELLLGSNRSKGPVNRLRRMFGSADYRQSSPQMRAIMSRVVNEDLTDRLPLIKAPTLLIWGEKDTATPISDARKMERLIPGAGLVSFAEAGHYSFLDNPSGFDAALTSFLS